MAVNGGSIKSVQLNGRGFGVAGDSDASLTIQNYTNELQPNGNKTSRVIQTAKVAGIDSVQISIDDSFDDYQYIKELNDSTEDIDITVELASGAIYAGSGKITGDFSLSTQSGTVELGLMFRRSPVRQQ